MIKVGQVSIILICYNNFNFIDEALRSIFCQTHPDIQLIISDDASKIFDKSKLERFIQKYRSANISDVIININAENQRTVLHLEKLYPLCTGELITIIAADDAFAEPDVISSFMAEYESHNKQIGVITSILEMCDTKLNHTGKLFTSKDDIKLINSGNSGKLFEELSYRCIMPSSGTAIAPRVYAQLGSLSDNYVFVEDWCSHARMARMGIKIYCMDKVTVLHRDGGVSHGNKRANNDVYLQYYRDLLSIYEVEVQPYANVLSLTAAERAKKYYIWRKTRYNQLITEHAARSSSRKKIVFYFRKNVIAKGDFALFYCIAAEIAKNPEYLVICVNNSNPELQHDYLDSGIYFCDITADNQFIFQDATFVVAFNQLFFLMEEISNIKTAKILLLFLHPQILDWFLLQVPKCFSLQSLGKLLSSNNAYGFMDIANYLAASKKFSAKLEKRYFPVVVKSTQHAVSQTGILNKKEINIAWLGRLDGDKISSLLNFLDNLLGFDFGKRITIHLVGDGNANMRINVNKYAPFIRFIFNSYLYGETRDNYLRENADIVLAMGISAVNAAMLKIPTIIPIVSMNTFRSNKFIFLCDTTEYCLGSDEDSLKLIGSKTYTAHRVVEMIYSDVGKKEEIGEKCYDYVCANFTVENQKDQFLRLINGTSLTVAKARRNFSIELQRNMFAAYKQLRGNRNYSDFLVFRTKLRTLLRLKTKDKIATIKKYIKR